MIGAVNSVSIAELQSAGAEHPHIPSRGSSVRRNDDVSVRDDLLPFDACPERYRTAVVVALHDFTVLRANDAIARGNRLAGTEVYNAKCLLVRLLYIMPIGRNPGGILILRLHGEATARSFEAPLSARSAHELLAAARRDWRLE